MASKLQIGDLIAGRYRLEETLGEGAYGEVWRATQINVARPVAIKFLKTFVADPSAQARFEREAKALARLQHPNCLTLLDFGYDTGAFLVTEFVPGQRLDQWTKGNPSVEDILEVTRQILNVLAHAHEQKIVHRDLKPPNIIISEDVDQGLQVKVLDFGIASVVGAERGDITKTGEVFGTPGYMSPEQLLGETNVGPTADLYSVGVMLFQMIEGHRLFDGNSGIEIALKHLASQPPPLTAVAPPGVAEVVERLLRKDPLERPQSAREVLRALPARSTVPSPAQPSIRSSHAAGGPPPPATETVAVNHSRLALLAGVLVAVVCALVGVVVWISSSEEAPDRLEPPRTTLSSGFIKNTAPAERPTPRHEDMSAPSSTPSKIDRASPGCGSPFESTGLQRVTAMTDVLESDSALVWVPTTYDPNRAHPVVLLFHDTGQSAAELIKELGIEEVAERDGVIIVAAEDNRLIYPWNDPGSWARAEKDLDVAAEALCIDREQVYLFGYGAGGNAAENVACRIRGVKALAVAAHRLVEGDTPCAHENMPYLFIVPMKDERDPNGGGVGCLAGEEVVSVAEHERVYREIHGCAGPRRHEQRHTDGQCFTWDCKTTFVACHVDGGRPLPGAKPRLDSCEGTASKFPYRDKIWDFLFASRTPETVDSE